MSNDNNDIWKDQPVSYWDDGVRFGTGWEMIAEIKTLQTDLNAARAKLAALTIEHENAMQALMLGEDEAKKELLAARAKLAKLEGVAQMAMRPERDAYDQYHDWHGRLRGAAEAALAAKDAAEGRVG